MIMINKIRIKLVVGYTLAIIGVMIAASVAGYMALQHITVTTNKKSLLTYLDTESHESIEMLKEWKKHQNINPDIRSFTAHKLAFNNIVYWVTPDNSILMAEELDSNISASIRQVIKNWKNRSLKIKTLYLSAPNSNTVWHFLMVSKDIYDGDTYLGKVFVGTNLSPLDRISSKYATIAIIIIILVSVLAFFIGNYFASKAIKPIKLSMQKQKEFVGDASHEMRTPLSVLLSSIDMVDGTPRDKNILEAMRSEIIGMRDLVSNLLVLARIEDTEKKVGFGNFDLAKLAESVVMSMQIMANDKKISISLNCVENLQIFANESNIRNLLSILLDNAIKYSGSDTHINIEIKKLNDWALISVKDEGVGIAVNEFDKIFERFYRVDKARSREQGSFGLGLPLAKKIVELHRGKIEVESKLQEGATFIITLPLAQKA